MVDVQVRFCPKGAPTYDRDLRFARVPCRGESVVDLDGERWVVVEIDWHEDGTIHVIAHDPSRPRARALMGWEPGEWAGT